MIYDLKHNHYDTDIVLPRIHGGGTVVVDGKGQKITLGPNSKGFTTPTDNPLTDTSTRYIIRDLIIQGGKKAIELKATFGSTIENVTCIAQTEAAIHCEFALMTTIRQCMITNPAGHGIWMGTGDFDGWGTNRNSQCNASIVDQCRVYTNGNMTGNSYTFLNSNGVKVRNCVSEGWAHNGWCLYYGGRNAWTKSFEIDGFHMEHATPPSEGGIYLEAMAHSPITLRELFIQGWNSTAPAVKIGYNALTIFEKVGWWTSRMNIELTHQATRIRYRDCHPDLNNSRLVRKTGAINYNNTHMFP